MKVSWQSQWTRCYKADVEAVEVKSCCLKAEVGIELVVQLKGGDVPIKGDKSGGGDVTKEVVVVLQSLVLQSI